MKQHLRTLFNSACALALLATATTSLHAQCAALPLPYTEGFGSVNLNAACSWSASSAPSGASWSVEQTNYGGGTTPEVQAYGDNACAGCVETVSLTLASPLNTTGATSLQLSFRHKLYVTNQATSGPVSGTLRLQTSPDGTTWTDRWTQSYSISGTSLTSVLSGSINVPAFNPSANNTYMRFAITGVMFKVWGWLIDDVSATAPVVTGMDAPEETLAVNSVYPNPAENVVNINLSLLSKDCVSLQLFDGAGRLVKEQADVINAGNPVLSLPITDLAAGIYSLKVISGTTGMSKMVKFVKP